MSFNIASRLNSLSATTTSLLNDLSENYYTKDGQLLHESANRRGNSYIYHEFLHEGTNRHRDSQLEEPASGDKNDNDATDPVLVNNSQILVSLQSVQLETRQRRGRCRGQAYYQQDP